MILRPSFCVVRPLRCCTEFIRRNHLSREGASERTPLSMGLESKPNPPFYSFRSPLSLRSFGCLLTRLLNETFKLAPWFSLSSSSSCQARCTADYVLFKHQFGPPPRPLPSLHLRGGRGPKIMAGFQQFRLGFNVARGINGAPTKRTGGRARRWRFAALTQPPPNPEESLDKRRRLPSLPRRKTHEDPGTR